MDFLYITITVVFFVVAILYVRGCAALGREDSQDERGHNAD